MILVVDWDRVGRDRLGGSRTIACRRGIHSANISTRRVTKLTTNLFFSGGNSSWYLLQQGIWVEGVCAFDIVPRDFRALENGQEIQIR